MIAPRDGPVPQSRPRCLSRSLGPCAVVAASGLNPVRLDGGDISPRLTKVANLQPPALRAFIAPPLSGGSCRHGGDAVPRPGYARGGTRPPRGQRGRRRPPAVPPHE